MNIEVSLSTFVIIVLALLLAGVLFGISGRGSNLQVQPSGGIFSYLILGLGGFILGIYFLGGGNPNISNMQTVANNMSQNNSSDFHFQLKRNTQESNRSQFEGSHGEADLKRAGPELKASEMENQHSRRINQTKIKMALASYHPPEQRQAWDREQDPRDRDLQRFSNKMGNYSQVNNDLVYQKELLLPAYSLQIVASSNKEAILEEAKALESLFPNLEAFVYAAPNSSLFKVFLGEYATASKMIAARRRVELKLGSNVMPISYERNAIQTDYIYALD